VLQHAARNGTAPEWFAKSLMAAIQQQHTAIHSKRCNMLQHTAAHCYNTRNGPVTKLYAESLVAVIQQQHAATLQQTQTHCSALQRTATYCNILQHTATYLNTLQHTATQERTSARVVCRDFQ